MKARNHGERHASRPASFLTQTVLIAAPLVVLSALTLYSLRRDQAVVEQDVRDRLQMLASDFARQWSRQADEQLAAWVQAQAIELGRSLPATAAGESAGRTGPQLSQVAPAGRSPERLDSEDAALADVPQLQSFVMSGQLRWPVEYPRLPEPREWSPDLTLDQARLWRNAEAALFQQRDQPAARSALLSLIDGRLPEPVRANAELDFLILQAGQHATEGIPERLSRLARRNSDVRTESGAPLADVALIQALRLSVAGRRPAGLLREVVQRVIFHPSFLTPELIAALDPTGEDPGTARSVQSSMRVWRTQEHTRSILKGFLSRGLPAGPDQIWLEEKGQPILTLYHPMVSAAGKIPGGVVTLLPWRLLQRLFLNALEQSPREQTSRVSASIQIGDRRWVLTPSAQAPAPAPAGRAGIGEDLAYADGYLVFQPELAGLSLGMVKENLLALVPGAIPDRVLISAQPVRRAGFVTSCSFRLGLSVADPEVLYASHRQRLWLIVGLVLSSAAAAGVGLVSAWRAFQRQLQLAEMTSNFVSSVSHELRAPLASVCLMAERLDQGRIASDEKRRDYFRLIVQECRRLSSLVENVLDFSRITQRREQYEFEPVDVKSLVSQTVKLMELPAAERGVALALSQPPMNEDERQPCWDAQAVQQALVNLIDNAIKHSPAGAAVKIGLELEMAPGEQVAHRLCLSVNDQGQGIPDEEQARIFEPFYRRGPELRRETRGIGIGLSIVKHVAEAHHGFVRVESVVGRGSCFTLVLPLNARSPVQTP